MSLLDALSSAKSGLITTGRRAAVTSTNIANVQTAGYVRREAVIVERTNGVSIDSIARFQNEALVRTRRDATSASARADVVAQMLSSIATPYGRPGSTDGLFSAFSRMQGDLESLRTTPESVAAQDTAASSIKELAQSIVDTATHIQSQRELADANLAADIEAANGLLHDIHDLNNRILAQGAAGADTASLEDQRDQALNTLSEYIPIRTNTETGGKVRVITESGLPLVGGTINEIEFTPSIRVGPLDVSEENGGNLSIPTVAGEPIGPLSGTYGETDGRIAGWLMTRDQFLPEQADSLDAFALELGQSFAAAGLAVFEDGGTPIDPLNVRGLSTRLSVLPDIDPDQGGSAVVLRDGLPPSTSTGPSDDTLLTALVDAVSPFDTQLSQMVSNISSEVFRAERLQAGNQSRLSTLVEAEAATSAVDLDYEMQTLLSIEQAYSANARVIQTVSDMFDRLLSL